MSSENEPAAPSGAVVNLVACEILKIQWHSPPLNFLMLNLKDFCEEQLVDPLVPNHIPTLIEICRILLFVTD